MNVVDSRLYMWLLKQKTYGRYQVGLSHFLIFVWYTLCYSKPLRHHHCHKSCPESGTHPPTHPHVIWQKPLSILDNVWIVAGLRWVVDDKRCCWCVHYSLTPTTTNRRNGFSSSCRSRNSRWSATSTKCIRWVGTHISYYCCRPMSQRHLLPHNVGYMQAMYSQCRSNPSVCHTVTPHEASQNGWITIA